MTELLISNGVNINAKIDDDDDYTLIQLIFNTQSLFTFVPRSVDNKICVKLPVIAFYLDNKEKMQSVRNIYTG